MPRQARDKHRENSKKDVFRTAAALVALFPFDACQAIVVVRAVASAPVCTGQSALLACEAGALIGAVFQLPDFCALLVAAERRLELAYIAPCFVCCCCCCCESRS